MFLPRIRERLAYGLVSLAVIASPAMAADIASQQVADGVWLFQGAGANVVAVSDGRNLLVVDGGLEENSRDLYEAIRETTGARVISTLINTHWHPEQVGLNALAAESGATIVAHDQTAMYLSNTVTAPRLYGERRIPPLPPEARPTEISRYGGEMEIAGQRVEYGYLPAAHTNGDFYVFLPDRNVLVAGGAVGSESWPLIDIHNGGIVGGLVQAHETLGEMVSDDTIVIAAEGAPITGADVKRHRDMYRQFFRDISFLMNEGMGFNDVVVINPLQGHEGEFGDPSRFLDGAYRSKEMAEVPD